MKSFLLLASLLFIGFAGCMKHDQGCASIKPQDEEPQILAYASANGITATKHSSGLYYQIIEGGTGAWATVNSQVTVSYTGKLLNGNTFDQNSSYTEVLNKLIEGWQIGIPLIKKGGRIKLIIPSSLAYGCNGSGASIPANSVLYFDVSLIDVK
jgi:FKBP-type peptidyl-prolyl cis-trans isomerase FkpA